MTAEDGRLAGTAVVVTGAGSGIGRAVAHAFADNGARVLIAGRTESTLADTARNRPAIRTLAVDITAEGAAERIAETTTREFGRIDVLVNNAAVVTRRPLGEIDERQARAQLATNLLAPLLLTQACLEQLRSSKGTIINVSTSGAVRGWPMHSVYGASKAGLDFLTRTWAVELAPAGVRVVSVAPGPVETDIAQNAGLSPAQVDRLREAQRGKVPLGRIGHPDEIAWWVLNLAYPESGFATGVVLPVDGGASIAL